MTQATDHQLWIDTINLEQQRGHTLAQAVSVADTVCWPFRMVNGEQTPESKALEANKAAHADPKFNPATCTEEALL